MYSLLIGDGEAGDFLDWPVVWTRPEGPGWAPPKSRLRTVSFLPLMLWRLPGDVQEVAGESSHYYSQLVEVGFLFCPEDLQLRGQLVHLTLDAIRNGKAKAIWHLCRRNSAAFKLSEKNGFLIPLALRTWIEELGERVADQMVLMKSSCLREASTECSRVPWYSTNFVGYVRKSFQWGGFPGWERYSERPEKEPGYLSAGLLPI